MKLKKAHKYHNQFNKINKFFTRFKLLIICNSNTKKLKALTSEVYNYCRIGYTKDIV